MKTKIRWNEGFDCSIVSPVSPINIITILGSIVEICCCTKCYTEPVAPETSQVYSCYLSKLEIKFRSNSNPVYHLLFIDRMFAVYCKVTLHNIKNQCNIPNFHYASFSIMDTRFITLWQNRLLIFFMLWNMWFQLF